MKYAICLFSAGNLPLTTVDIVTGSILNYPSLMIFTILNGFDREGESKYINWLSITLQ